MRYFDLIIQTVIIFGGVFFILFTASSDDSMFSILVTQLLLGVWQMMSSFLSVMFQSYLWRSKLIHLISASIYLILLLVLANGSIRIDGGVWAYIALTVPAWMLGLYYYILTWKTVIPKKKRSRFLPHLSF